MIDKIFGLSMINGFPSLSYLVHSGFEGEVTLNQQFDKAQYLFQHYRLIGTTYDAIIIQHRDDTLTVYSRLQLQ